MWYMNEERQILVNAFREFAENEIRPMVPKMEENEEYPREAIRKLGELGMLGLALDEEYGGAGADYINFGLMLEEFAKESHGFTLLAYLASTLTINVIHKMCTPEQLERFVKPALTGDILLGVGFTEPCGVGNPAEYETTAVMDGDEVVINGGKILITNCDVADYLLTWCRTGDFDPATMSGVSLIAIPTKAEGYSVGHMEHKLGWKGSHTGQVYFNNIRVPKENVIGPWGLGFALSNVALLPEFSAYGPMNLGAMEACYSKTKAYLKNRVQCGVSLWDAHESIRLDMTRMWAKIENYRQAVYGVLEMRNRGVDVSLHAIALKAEGEELLREVASQCVEFHGGMGTVYETGIERFYRDAKMGALGCGSNRTLLNTISGLVP